MSDAELQQDVQRVATTFMDRIAQTGESLGQNGHRAEQATQLMRRVLLYNSSVLDIATGPFPQVNALDMQVFATLCRNALERHWIPHCFGDWGLPLRDAFTLLEQAAGDITGKFLDRRQQQELRELVAGWQAEHADQFRVEGVRLQEFSEHAGTIENERSKKARGLLGQVRSATQAADQALVISERAFFVAHRMPFLIRLQSRIGVQETLCDSLARLDDVEAVLRRVPGVRPLLHDLVAVTRNATAALRETRALTAAVEPHLLRFTEAGAAPSGPGLAQTLESLNTLTDRSLSLVRELRAAADAVPASAIDAAEQRVDRVVRRWVIYVLSAGLIWTAFFWVAFFVVWRL
jgi:hypothetical protein